MTFSILSMILITYKFTSLDDANLYLLIFVLRCYYKVFFVTHEVWFIVHIDFRVTHRQNQLAESLIEIIMYFRLSTSIDRFESLTHLHSHLHLSFIFSLFSLQRHVYHTHHNQKEKRTKEYILYIQVDVDIYRVPKSQQH